MKFIDNKIEELKIKWNQQKKIPTHYPFIMKEVEKVLLKKYLQNSSKYLEFGLGGSTIFALINTNIPIISIDTNVSWINFMKGYKIIKSNLNKRLEIEYVDIGPTKSWGYPVGEEHKEKFPNFSSTIFQKYSADDFDVVLVDARFRVACVYSILLNRKHNLENLTILVHDYSIREDYQVIEKYLDVVENAANLFVFKPKKTIDYTQLLEDYNHYKYIAD